MMVINILICFVLLLQPERLIEAADIETGRFQFLRRRTGSQVKRVEQAEAVGTVEPMERDAEAVIAPQNHRFISFGLRKRTKSDDIPDYVPNSTSSFTFAGLFSNVVSGLVRFADSIDELENQYIRKQEQEQQAYSMTESHIMRREEAANILQDKEKFKKYADAFDHDGEKDEEESDVGSASVASASESESNSNASSIYGNDDLSSGDDLNYRAAGRQLDLNDLNRDDDVINIEDETELALVTYNPAISNSLNNEDEHGSIPSFPFINSQESSIPQFNLEPVDKIRSDYVILSDSDSESWEKIEKTMLENVQVLVHKPDTVNILNRVTDQSTIIQFLASVFIKLAHRIFFKPSPVHKLLHKSKSFEDFVFDFSTHEEIEKADVHKFLDFETAHRILFYNVASNDHDDWCLLLPDNDDFFLALDFLTHSLGNDLSQIETDLTRLPQAYYGYYAEKMGRERMVGDTVELQDKVRLILAFIMTFESKESSTTAETGLIAPKSQLSTDSPISHDRQISYVQGFDQVVAYFAINFDLDHAGPIAHRFFQLYMIELINFDSGDLADIRRRIDSRAVKIIRKYLKDKIGSTVLDFEPLLGILELYPFSSSNATILYFTSATTWTDLDRLIQFLLVKVPQSQAYKSVSLLAASNMLYTMLALDQLFVQELGSQQWTAVKDLINKSNSKKRFDILDSLVLRFMGDLFLISRDKIVHAGKDFDDFLHLTESLIPYLHEFN